MNRPATEEQIMLHLGKLALHYPQPDLPEAANASRWDDWFDDLADMPEDVLAAACKAWRNSPQRFGPSPGQLKKMVGGESHWGVTRHIYERRCREVLALVEAT